MPPLNRRNAYDPQNYGALSSSSNVRIIIGVVCAVLVVLFVLLAIWRRKKLPLPTHEHRLNYHLPTYQPRRRPAAKKQVITVEQIDQNFPKRTLEPWQLEVTGEEAKHLRTDVMEETAKREQTEEEQANIETEAKDLQRTSSSADSLESTSTHDADGKSVLDINKEHFRLTCPICLEEFTGESEVRVLSCRHTFHAACLDPWLTNRSYCCPSCRKPAIELQEGAVAKEDATDQQTITPPQPDPIQAPIVAAPEPAARQGRLYRFLHPRTN